MGRWLIALLLIILVAGGLFHIHSLRSLRDENRNLRSELEELHSRVQDIQGRREEVTRELATAEASLKEARAKLKAAGGASGESSSDAEIRQRADQLLVKARAAIEKMEGSAFLDSAFALIDLGEHGFEALITLTNGLDLETLGKLEKAMQADLVTKAKLFSGILLRLPGLSKFTDAVMARGAVLDNATMIALSLVSQYSVPGGQDDRVRQFAAILGAARESVEGESNSEEGARRAILISSIRALGKTKNPLALEALEQYLLQDSSRRYGSTAINAIADLGLPGSIDSLMNVYRELEENHDRGSVARALQRIQGEEANARLWSLLAEEKDPAAQGMLWRSLAGRPENALQIAAALKEGLPDERSRTSMIFELETGSPERNRELFWELHRDLPRQEDRDAALAKLVWNGDGQAANIAIDRLVTGSHLERLSWSLGSIPEDQIRQRGSDIMNTAANYNLPMDHRIQAAAVLARVDRGNAVSAILQGYDGLPAASRSRVVQALGYSFRGEESARLALESIAETDSSEKIQSQARETLKRYPRR